MKNEANFDNNITNNLAGDFDPATLFDNSIWLNTKDAAIFLRKFHRKTGKPSQGAIRTATYRGVLHAKKWNGRNFYKRAELNRLLEIS